MFNDALWRSFHIVDHLPSYVLSYMGKVWTRDFNQSWNLKKLINWALINWIFRKKMIFLWNFHENFEVRQYFFLLFLWIKNILFGRVFSRLEQIPSIDSFLCGQYFVPIRISNHFHLFGKPGRKKWMRTWDWFNIYSLLKLIFT